MHADCRYICAGLDASDRAYRQIPPCHSQDCDRARSRSPSLPATRPASDTNLYERRAGAGQLSRRGGLLDIYPPQASQPYRLEFFGDEIETIRTFDPETQRSAGRTDNESIAFWLTPVREALEGL